MNPLHLLMPLQNKGTREGADEFKLAEDQKYIWSNKWNHNTPLEAKETVALDLVQIKVINMKNEEEGSIKVHVN